MYQLHFQEVKEILAVASIDREENCNNYFKKGGEYLTDSDTEGETFSYQEIVARAIHVDSEHFDDACEIIGDIVETLDDEHSVAFAYAGRVLYVRIYDGKQYLFPLPIMMSENADALMMCISLAGYCTQQMVPFIITDVPREELEYICSVFSHVNAHCYDDDEDTFLVRVLNECDMLDEVPTIELEGITLDKLTDADRDRYAELCRDRKLNEYWGYDVYSDNPDGDPDFYLDTVKREFYGGVALTLAVREGGELVGEATVYGFDYRGTASISVRVMTDCHGRGIGSRATKAIIEVARSMGLSTLTAEIFEENVASVKMTSKYMQLVDCFGGKALFTLKL